MKKLLLIIVLIVLAQSVFAVKSGGAPTTAGIGTGGGGMHKLGASTSGMHKMGISTGGGGMHTFGAIISN